MDKDRRKAMLICSEVMGYFVEHRAQRLQVDFDVSNGRIAVTVSGHMPDRPHDLAALRAALNEPRQPEMDEYYDGLLGYDSAQHGYHLLGAVVDEAEIRYEDGFLSIHVIRRQ